LRILFRIFLKKWQDVTGTHGVNVADNRPEFCFYF
jgi:hypothetical protein